MECDSNRSFAAVRMFVALSMAHRVFVYGTLKRNEPNHYWLTNKKNGESSFLASGSTVQKYPLIIATRFNIPFVLKHPGKGHAVRGEVYYVDDYMLEQLDILEDHPNYFIRVIDDIKIHNKITNTEETIKCWIYTLSTFNRTLMKLPMMDDYTSLGSHGRPYLDIYQESIPEDLEEECDKIVKMKNIFILQ